MNPMGQIWVKKKTSMTATKDIKNGLQNATKILIKYWCIAVEKRRFNTRLRLTHTVGGGSLQHSLLLWPFLPHLWHLELALFSSHFLFASSFFCFSSAAVLSSSSCLLLSSLLCSRSLRSSCACLASRLLCLLFSFFLFFCTFFALVFLQLFLIKSITYAVQHQLAFWHHRIGINSLMITLHVIPFIAYLNTLLMKPRRHKSIGIWEDTTLL